MATVDELERLDREIEEAERRALGDLAEHLREAVLDMPSESKLARAFVRHAKRFDLWATGRSAGLWGALELEEMRRELADRAAEEGE